MKMRLAFTMIELVFVIAVIGILASLAIPRLERDLLQESADNVLSAVRYTQHMALSDNKHEFDNASWQRKFWQIRFLQCEEDNGWFYTVGSDESEDGTIDRGEAAIDPANGKPMYWDKTGSCKRGGDGSVSPNIFLSRLYGVTNVIGTGGCNQTTEIGFDFLGRPHIGFANSNVPDHAGYMRNACVLTFTLSDGDTFDLHIEPETGYAYIER